MQIMLRPLNPNKATRSTVGVRVALFVLLAIVLILEVLIYQRLVR